MKGRVSIIIPCYNGEKFIQETLNSVFEQTYTNYEIILVDDGSTDDSAEIIKTSFSGKPYCQYIYQENRGVSAARNKGLKEAVGEFVLFLDADDILEIFFLSSRIEFLYAETEYDLCGTAILRIDDKGALINCATAMQAPDDNIVEQILLYQQPYESVPSNLLIRRQVILDHHIIFEEKLSSTADKFFLCCLGRFAKCKNIEGGKLLYRVASESMSHSISTKLLLDNAAYFQLLKQTGIIPLEIRKTVLLKNYYILAGLAFRLKDYWRFLNFFLKYCMVKIGLKKS